MPNYSMHAGSRENRLPCIVYHRLHKAGAAIAPELLNFSVEVGRFREHLAALADAGYTALTPQDIYTWQGGSRRVRQPILITFDDGWASNFELARPELKRHRMPWVLFVTADPHAAVFEEGGDVDRPLTESEIVALSKDGTTIASHGLTHRPLTQLSTYDVCWELVESRRRLETLVEKPVEWFAAPFGLSNRKIEKAVRMAGYRVFASGKAGDTPIDYEDFLNLHRIAAHPSWSGEDLINALSRENLKRSARRANLKRRIRLLLGHDLSCRIRTFLRERRHAGS